MTEYKTVSGYALKRSTALAARRWHRTVPTSAQASGMPAAGSYPAVDAHTVGATLGLKPQARPLMDAFLARPDIGLEGLAERSRPEHARQFTSVRDLEQSDLAAVQPAMLKHRGQQIENWLFADRIFCVRTRQRRGPDSFQVLYATANGQTTEVGQPLHDHQRARALAEETARQLEADDVVPADLNAFDEPGAPGSG